LFRAAEENLSGLPSDLSFRILFRPTQDSIERIDRPLRTVVQMFDLSKDHASMRHKNPKTIDADITLVRRADDTWIPNICVTPGFIILEVGNPDVTSSLPTQKPCKRTKSCSANGDTLLSKGIPMLEYGASSFSVNFFFVNFNKYVLDNDIFTWS
jgi:hypothetical protein